MKEDKGYWDTYYGSNRLVEEPSLFAQFVLGTHVEPGDTLIELGCGNGRDSLFFAQNGVRVHAVDQSENAIALLADKNPFPHLSAEVGDFTNLGKRDPFDHVYSRFTLHTITEEEEDRVIAWAFGHLKDGGKFLIEARGRKNELYGLGEPVPKEPHAYIYENHYRRFIDIDTLQKKLKAQGFEIIFAEERPGFAPFNDSDQHFIRMIALRKKA